MHTTRDKTIALKLPKRFGEHLLAHTSDNFFQPREPHRLTGFKRFDDQQRPFVGYAIQKFADERFVSRDRSAHFDGIHTQSIA